MQKTFSEISAAEQTSRERAMLFESLQGDLLRLQATVPRLEKELGAYDTSALRQIEALAAKIPTAIVTSGNSSYIAGGQSARAVVLHACACGLETAARKEAEAKRQLTEAKAELAKVELALKEFEEA